MVVATEAAYWAKKNGLKVTLVDKAALDRSGAVAMGLGSRALFNRAQRQPYFIDAMNALNSGSLVPVPGGVLIRRDGVLIGALGITGDSSDNDEKCAVSAIQQQGLEADTGG